MIAGSRNKCQTITPPAIVQQAASLAMSLATFIFRKVKEAKKFTGVCRNGIGRSCVGNIREAIGNEVIEQIARRINAHHRQARQRGPAA
jgi:hypothetical protein